MKNEKVDFSDLLDFGAAIVVLRLIRSRIIALNRKRAKLPADDEMTLFEISHEIAALESVVIAVKEIALINAKQFADGKGKA